MTELNENSVSTPEPTVQAAPLAPSPMELEVTALVEAGIKSGVLVMSKPWYKLTTATGPVLIARGKNNTVKYFLQEGKLDMLKAVLPTNN